MCDLEGPAGSRKEPSFAFAGLNSDSQNQPLLVIGLIPSDDREEFVAAGRVSDFSHVGRLHR